MTRGQIFAARDGLILIEDYHYGDDVDYEFATQMWLNEGAQKAITAALNLSNVSRPECLAKALQDHFKTFRAARQFADESKIAYELTTDLNP